MKQKKWYRPKCDGCKSFNPECIRGYCCIHDNNWIIPKGEREEGNTS